MISTRCEPLARWSSRGLLLCLALMLTGCGDEAEDVTAAPDADAVDAPSNDGGADTQQDSTGPEPDAPIEVPPFAEDVEPGPTGLRRLTQAQFLNCIHDVFGEHIVVPRLAEPDVAIEGLFSVGASAVSLSPRGVESLAAASYAIAEQAMEPTEHRAALFSCEPTETVDDACATDTLRTLGLRLWRRPLTDVEVEVAVGIASASAEVTGDFYDGMEYAVASLLQSPNFIFRAEVGEPDPHDPDLHRFTGYEMASRLSFFLWNGAPDDELLAAAEAGELDTVEGLRAHAERMIDDPRTRRGIRNYFSEQLELHRLHGLSKDPTLFEQYNALLGPDAAEETLLMLERVVFDADSDFRDVMTTRETFVNRRLAAIYDIPAPVSEGFGLVELPRGSGRAGLLGQASFANLHSHAVSSSATLRGMAVREILLCSVVPPPPSDVDVSIPSPSGETLTLRDRVAEHLENESCAGCHLLMDPIGLGLENFDAIGVWRETDNGAEIDVTGDLDGVEFANPVELGRAIRNHQDFAPCVVRTLTRYAVGRVEVREELDHLDVLAAHFAAVGYRVRPMLLEIISSPMFRFAGEPQ